jgi:ADP-ribosylglycohydrolase
MSHPSRVRGCLLGGAVGDALGAPIEFLSLQQIRQLYGPDGLTGLEGNPAPITDDTQMTLFTVEGLLRGGDPVAEVYRAHLRWLDTQRLPGPPPQPDGSPQASGLASQPWLYAARAPGNTCLSGLRSPTMGTPAQPQNPQSKGCGAVMRSAPFGLDPSRSAEEAFELAVACAVQTHGHPSGYLAAGAFAAMVRVLLDGRELPAAVQHALGVLAKHDRHEEVSAALVSALESSPVPSARDVERLGEGWVAEEALAIGVFCALAYPGPSQVRRALLLAVNHSGDSDSTGSICGNLLGAWYGEDAIPTDWTAAVEGRDAILKLADALATQ